MNRRERRRAARSDPGKYRDMIAALTPMLRCPDCNSDIELTDVDGLLTVLVRHDDTCPVYRAMQGER
ncbi:hypothetical protein [Gordonia paraffinivorans]|uniref:hypothetical protein n=1 Tax=Gordonia paraffinivorans TaxID=175628 RepID=UPI0011B252EF|nr:hypothetical protein [Gordonia paraffinivorans]